MRYSKWLAAVMVLGAASLAAVPPAAAAPVLPHQFGGAAIAQVDTVQFRHGGPRHGGWNRGGWNRGHGYHRGYGYGPALGGLAVGAIIGGAIASSQAQAAVGNAEAYCAQRFKSYDPASGTYLGYDGLRRACP